MDEALAEADQLLRANLPLVTKVAIALNRSRKLWRSQLWRIRLQTDVTRQFEAVQEKLLAKLDCFRVFQSECRDSEQSAACSSNNSDNNYPPASARTVAANLEQSFAPAAARRFQAV
uniref:Peptidase M41 domain-containing protein n=1 Tax=Globodera rostochiensis TaxID=31243 RepID=A0A914H6A2_GLORO